MLRLHQGPAMPRDLHMRKHWSAPQDASWPAAGCPQSGPSGPHTLRAFGVTSLLHHSLCCMDSTASMQDMAPHVEATHICQVNKVLAHARD